MALKRWLGNPNERFSATKAGRLVKMTQQMLDPTLSRLLVGNTAGARLPEGSSAYFPPDDCKIAFVSGDRSTGLLFNIGIGHGWKNVGTGETDADEPTFQPVFVEAAQPFTTANSDVTNPRIDRVFLKPKRIDQNASLVDVIDPATKNISQSSLNTETAWTYDWVYVAGTPAATPVAPAPPVGFVVADAIADITVQPGSGTFSGTDLTDLRDTIAIDSAIVPGFTGAPASQITVATPLTDSDVQAALVRQDAAIGSSFAKGFIDGRLEYTNTTSITLSRSIGSIVRVEIDDVILSQSADLVFTMPTDLDVGAEAASTWYYAYLLNSGGTLVKKLAATAPVVDPSLGKVGYHPTNTTWRYVGAVYNDASSNFTYFKQAEMGEIWMPRTLVTTTEPGASFTALSLAAFIPATASHARVVSEFMATNSNTFIRHDFALDPEAATPSLIGISHTGAGGGSSNHRGRSLWILAPASAQTVYHRVDFTGFSIFEVDAAGYKDPYGA